MFILVLKKWQIKTMMKNFICYIVSVEMYSYFISGWVGKLNDMSYGHIFTNYKINWLGSGYP